MDRIELTATALARTRLHASPLGMFAAVLRLAASGARHPTLGRVGAHLAPGLRTVRAPLVRELVPRGGEGFIPLVVPPPVPGVLDLGGELDLLAARSDEECRGQLALAGRDLPLATSLLDRGLLTRQLVDEVRRLWSVTLEDTWPAIERCLREEMAARGTQIAHDGLESVLSSLHPRIHWAGSSLVVDRPRDKVTLVDEAGLTLVPSAFDTIPRLAVESPWPCISYPVSMSPPAPDGNPAARLIGRTRAQVLAALDRPRTTVDLAARLSMPTSTVSDHLRVLHRAGVVSRTRQGRVVRYERLPGGLGSLGA